MSTPDTNRLTTAGHLTHRDIARWFAEAAARSKVISQARRERVMRWPDLRKMLQDPPLSYSRPENWSGWIPPATLPPDRDGNEALNDSPFRAQLVAIAAEALRRERDGLNPGDQTEQEAS